MGRCRFLYDNKITAASQIAVSSSFYGVIGGIYAEQFGSANAVNGGLYSGDEDLGYVVEIDSVSAGNEIGQATMRWSDDDGVTWSATGVTTSTDPYEISNGVTFQFTAGTGNDFELGDKWSFICKNNYGKQKLILLDRDFAYWSRSLDGPNTIIITFDKAENITALLMQDHNVTSAAVITLMGDDAAAWGSPAYSQVIPWNSEKIGYYLDQTYQYMCLQISDPTNPDGYIKIGNLYMGGYNEPLKNFSYNWEQITNSNEFSSISKKGSDKRSLKYLQEGYSLTFNRVSDDDRDALVAMYREIKNVSAGTVSPLFFNIDSDDPNDFYLMHMGPELQRTKNFLNQSTMSLDLTEVVKTNV